MRSALQVQLQNEFVSVEFSKFDLMIIFAMLHQHIEDEDYGFSMEEDEQLKKSQAAIDNLYTSMQNEDQRTKEECFEDIAQMRKQVLKLSLITETIANKAGE